MTTARLAARAARLETAMNAAVTRVTAALPSIGAEEAAAELEAAVPVTMKGQGPAWFLEELASHMTAHPDALTSGSSLCPLVLLRLARVLHEAGHQVVRPGCAHCGKVTADLRQLREEGRICSSCDSRSRKNGTCGRCGATGVRDHRQATRRRYLRPLLPAGSRGRRGVRGVRPSPEPRRAAARRRRPLPCVLETPPAHVRVVRRDRAGGAARRRRRLLPPVLRPAPAPAAPVREMRQDGEDQAQRPRRPARPVRQVLPRAGAGMLTLRAGPPLRPGHDRRADLPQLLRPRRAPPH